MSTKHLSEIVVHTHEPTALRAATPFAQHVLRALVVRHPRARVWEEERHSFLPNWSIRRFYRSLIPPTRYLAARRKSSE